MVPDSAASTPGQVRLEAGARGTSLILRGDWTLRHYTALSQAVSKLALDDETLAQLDLRGVGEMDTAGATLLVRLLGPERTHALPESAPGMSVERHELLLTVCDALRRPVLDTPKNRYAFGDVMAHIGRTTVILGRNLVTLLDFMGRTLLTFLLLLPQPRRWRLTPLVSHIEQIGLNAVPIVALLTFLVGAVVALLGATVLVDFGLAIYTVDLVTYSFMREFGVLLTAIMLAGRTASAFTAQIGSMKANEELDALRVQGLDPMELLVLPRVLALMVSLPLLTFIAVVSGLAGGGLVSLLSLDISLTRYLEIVHAVPLQHFWVGLSKAPLFAFMIGLIGCLEGFKSGASAESVGLHTTSSVVQSIFIVILLDAVAALYFMEAGW